MRRPSLAKRLKRLSNGPVNGPGGESHFAEVLDRPVSFDFVSVENGHLEFGVKIYKGLYGKMQTLAPPLYTPVCLEGPPVLTRSCHRQGPPTHQP